MKITELTTEDEQQLLAYIHLTTNANTIYLALQKNGGKLNQLTQRQVTQLIYEAIDFDADFDSPADFEADLDDLEL